MKENKVTALLWCVVCLISAASLIFAVIVFDSSVQKSVDAAKESQDRAQKSLDLAVKMKEMADNPPVIEILGGNATVVGKVIHMPANQTVTILCTRDGKPTRGTWDLNAGDADWGIKEYFDFYQELKDGVGILSINASSCKRMKEIYYHEDTGEGRIVSAFYYINAT